jgi:IS4 transposase
MGRHKDEAGDWSAAPEGSPDVLAVFDREGDVFEALETLQSLGHGYVIRATRSRRVVAHEALSFAQVEQSPVLGRLPFEVPRRAGLSPRSTILTFRALEMTLRLPRSRGRRGPSVTTGMVLVQEDDTPVEGERLCWYLLTSLPVTTLEQAAEVARLYRFRWRIEDFHMGLKTGCGLQKAQLHDFHAFQNLLALTSIAACKLLALRDAARAEAPTPPKDVVNETQRRLLVHLSPSLKDICTARDLLRAIARLGGFLGRKSDGEPGWRTLWWGWQKLRLMEAGADALSSRSG